MTSWEPLQAQYTQAGSWQRNRNQTKKGISHTLKIGGTPPRRNLPRNDRRVEQGQDPRGLINRTRFDRNVVTMGAPHLLEYNFNVDVSDIVFAISKIRDAKWPKPIQSDPSQRNYNLVCEFHNMYGHRTEDCHQLRDEVARLLNKGHLRELLSDRAKNQFRERETTKKRQMSYNMSST